MFEDSLIDSGKKNARKTWITFPLSVLLHLVILVAVIVVPLLEAESGLPPVKVIKVFMAAPPAPPPPPPPPAKKKKSSRANKKKQKKEEVEQKAIPTGRLVAPIEIPEEIEEEDISDFGFDEGVDGGVEGGVEGGVVGGVLGSPGTGDAAQAIQIASIQKPKLIKSPSPQYPPVALKAHIQGNVVINATTDIYGRVIQAQVINGHPLLRQAALAAIKQWVYEPYILNGVPRPVRFTVVIKFNLNNR